MNNLVPSSYYGPYGPGASKLDDIMRMLNNLGAKGGGIYDTAVSRTQPGGIGRIALGADANTQMGLKRGVGKIASAVPGVSKEAGMRFAMTNPGVRKALRFVPGLGLGLTALDAADVVAGNESLGNRGMDAAGMAIGGALGAAGGPLGIAAGASLGKMGSDALQYLFGDKLTPEQRKMREALMMLQGGRY